MKVRLPNGTVVKDVPEGVSPEELRDMAIKKGLADVSDFPDLEVQKDQESQEMLSFLAEQGWEVQDIQ